MTVVPQVLVERTTSSSTPCSPTSATRPLCWLCCDSPGTSHSCCCAQLTESSSKLKRWDEVKPVREGAANLYYRPSPVLTLSKMTNGAENGHTNGPASSSKQQHPSADKLVDELLDKYKGDNNSNTNANNTNGNQPSPQENLQAAQLELQQLEALQGAIQAKIDAKKHQVNEFQIRVSPFLSLEPPLLAYFARFLTEESLLQLEQSLPQLADGMATQWQTLDEQRRFQSNSWDGTPRERGIRFVLASQYARQMERSALYHYQPRQYTSGHYPWPERLYTREDFRNDFEGYDSGEEPPPNLEFFLRLSYRDGDDEEAPTRVLMEGFLSDYSDLDPWDSDHYSIIELDGNKRGGNNRVHFVCNDIQALDSPDTMGIRTYQNWRGAHFIDWPLWEQKRYMQRLALTVLACEPHTPNNDTPTQLLQSHLVVASRGFSESNQGLAIMPPRSYLAKARTANLLDCVNVALRPTHEFGQLGFRILIDWDTQDVFTRRKSILDHF